MKVRDARTIINLKKREQQLQKTIPATNAGIVDARQILKSKRKKNKSKFKAPVEIPTALVKKELGEVLKSAAGQKETSKKRNMFSKRVEFARGGILTVTSKGSVTSNIQSRKPASSLTANPEKFIVNNRKSIVVIKPNELVQQTQAVERPMEIDQDDDLENLTLEDFPDIKSLPRGLSSSLKTASQGSVVQRTPWKPGFSSVTNHLQLPVNTMVADTVEVTNNSSPQQQQQQGYTVYVTNLKDTVTQEDIVELFSDVGPLASAQLLQPGTALVVYFTKAEASQACDSYHNRLLDGQPMQCSLLPSSVSTGRSSLFSRLGVKVFPDSGLLPTSPSASTFLPSTFQQQHLPQTSKSQRSVQFTVKLP